MEERIIILLFGTGNDRSGMIAELQMIQSFIQLPEEQALLRHINAVLQRVQNMPDDEFEGFMLEMKREGVNNHE